MADGFDRIVAALATAAAIVPGLDPVDAEVNAFGRHVAGAIRLLEAAVSVQPILRPRGEGANDRS